MCGLVFILSRKPIETQILTKMRETLLHRGPDGFGQFIEPVQDNAWVGMAHRRLAVIDLAEYGNQPMHSDDGNFSLIYNGEIYNYLEIRSELIALGYTFKTKTDTEVLLKGYQAWGAKVVTKLNGMFAFIIWDRYRQQAFIARDRFGEKPLYYAEIPSGGMIFASEIKAILVHPEIQYTPCYEKIDAYLAYSSELYENYTTFYDKVYTFPQAHCVSIPLDGKVKDIQSYWNIDDQKYHIENLHHSDLIEKFSSLLKTSVLDRFKSQVPAAACLSGGLDSSSICSILGKELNEKLKVFSVRFDDDPLISEGNYMDCVVEKYNLSPCFISPTENDFLEHVEKLYFHQEYPFLSASMFLEFFLYKKIKAEGIKVMLDGQGSDELLGGYDFYFVAFQKECLYRKNFIRLLKNSYQFNKRLKMASLQYEDKKRRRFNPDIAMTGMELTKFFISNVLKNNMKLNNIFSNTVKDGMTKFMLPAQLHSSDRSSMAFSVETRFPFLDYNFVDFCLSLDTKILFSRGWSKHILRQAMHGILPKEIQWRPDKIGFESPQDLWLCNGLKEWSFNVLFRGDLANFKQYDYAKLESCWESHIAGNENYSSVLWRWISLGAWLTTNKNFYS